MGLILQIKFMIAALALLTPNSAFAQAYFDSVHQYDHHGNLLNYKDTSPKTPAEWAVQNLYSGDRVYYLIKFCYETREGFASVFINDVQLEKARQKAKDLEADAKEANPGLDTDAVWKSAVINSKGYRIDYESCQSFFLAMFRVKSSHSNGSAPGDAARKDF